MLNDLRNLPLGNLTKCQLCGSDQLTPMLDLGNTPPCDSLLSSEELNEAESYYPLKLSMCHSCDLVQIGYVVPPDILFHKEYPYRSGITEILANNLKSGAKKFVNDLRINKSGLAIDIGSNDGTFLKGFQETGMNVLGVEPTNIARIAIADGIPTEQEFFGEDLSKKIKARYGSASIITAANMFAHIPNLGSLIRGAENLLEEGGYFITESHYLLAILETLQFDSIYHEHLKYYSVKNLIQLFDYYDFTLVDAERIANYGGSIRAYAQKGKNHQRSNRIRELLECEEEAKISEISTWKTFEEKVKKSRMDCRRLFSEIKSKGQSTAAIGCPGRSSTLLNFYGLTPLEIPYIAEQSTSLKLGLYCAGVHIPVVDEEILFREQPDYALMLSWHYSEPIIKKIRDKGLKSKIIIPLPELTVLD